MARSIEGKRILVTGASSGIGHTLARQLAQAGGSVLAVARTETKLRELVEACTGPGVIEPHVGDVTVPEDRGRMIETMRTRFGGLDILINNAGVAGSGHFATSSEDLLRQTMEVNFFAPVELTRLAVPVLTDGKEPLVVYVASMCGRRAMPAWSEYSASKFALCGFVESMRSELARFDIDVTLIVPGLTNSGLPAHLIRHEAKLKVDYTKGMSTDYVSERILRAIRKGTREVVLGSEAKWMLRINRWFPRLVDRLIARRVRRLHQTDSE